MSPRRREQPVLWESGAFAVLARELRVSGAPEAAEWAAAGRALGQLRSGVQWAVGDWLLYGEQREFDENAYETAAEATGLKRGTLMNLKSVAKAFPARQRRAGMSWSHHALVAAFDEDRRVELLRAAETENLSWEELRARCQDLRHALAGALQEFPVGRYGLIFAAPPWPASPGDHRPDGYESMSPDDVAALAPEVQGIAAPNCVVYLTAVPTHLEDALTALRAWGFAYRTHHVVVHYRAGGGEFLRHRHHLLVVGTRGEVLPPQDTLRPDSVMQEGVEALESLERAYPEVPKVLLFARLPREGWTTWGEQLEQDRQARRMAQQQRHRAVRLREEPEVAEARA